SMASGDATTRIPATGSSAGTETLRVVEGGRRPGRLAAVDRDAVRPRLAGSEPAQHQGSPEQRRRPRTRDVADHVMSLERPNRGALGRRRAVHREAEPAPLVVDLRGPLEGGPADEGRLVHPGGPV